MAASFGRTEPTPLPEGAAPVTSAPVRDPLAYQPSPLAVVHSMEILAIAEEWRPLRSLATTDRFSAAFEPVEALPVARLGSA